VLGRHGIGIVSTVVVITAVIAVVAYALAAVGYPAHQENLNDGGVWVTSSHAGEFARLNKPVGQFDGGLYLGSNPAIDHDLDVVQDGSAVVAWDRTGAQLAAVDVTTMAAVPGNPATVPVNAEVAIGGGISGGTLAVLDKQTGRLWAMRIDPSRHLSDLTKLDRSAPPLDTKIGADAALAVSQSGSIFAVSASGTLTTIRLTDAGFTDPETRSLGALESSPKVTAVGETPVVLSGRQVILPGHDPMTLPGSGNAVLQQSGPATSTVLVATTTSLVSIDLGSAKAATVSSDGNGSAPAAPVQLGGCTFAAWSGSPSVYRTSCPSAGQTYVGHLTAASTALTYRVNRAQLVLNNPSDGNVWNVDGPTAKQVADWSTVSPPPKEDQTNKHNKNSEGVSAKKLPPKAVADDLGARPGRTTTLHVLDNDSDPAGNILAIDHVSAPDNPAAHLAISGDEQTITIALPESVSSPVRFTYEINDGQGQQASAPVTVTPTLGSANGPPVLCACFQNKVWSVGVSSLISIPVTGDWRDPDGDPITLVSATATAGSVTVTPDGDVLYTAPNIAPAANVVIKYNVVDGFGGTAEGSLSVHVLPANATQGSPPVAAPDVAMTTVGRSVTIEPLANDLPGADPTSSDAQLRLASPIAQQAGTTVTTDLAHGVVTFTAATAKVFVLPYTVSYGAQTASGRIRVDVQPTPRTPGALVAMPDTAVVYGQQSVTVDVLANDYDPAGNVLVVQAATAVEDNGLRVAIVGGRWLNIAATNSSPSARPQLVRYTVTDGISSATGEVAVTELPAATQAQPPIAEADTADVRAGDTVTIPVLDNDYDPSGASLSIVAGSVSIASGGGSAYVSNNLVRYVAPSSQATADSAATLSYTVTNGSATSNGTVTVAIHPMPADAAAIDSPPEPLPVVQRVVAGGSVVVKIPTSGVDPDGDLVTLVGIDTPGPHLGQITAMTADSLTYQAFPGADNVGTDVIGYRVTDRFGKVGTSVVRIGVVPPGETQPPVAVDDVITGAPGARLSVNVVANDFVAAGDQVTVAIKGDAQGASVDSKNKNILVLTAPAAGRTTVIPYELDDGSGQPSAAAVTVHSVAGYDNPPIARDDSAQPVSATATSAVVSVLANDSDPDLADELTVAKVLSSNAQVVAGKVSVTLAAFPQTIPYEITDGHGKSAMAVIFVPAAGAGAPYVKPGTVIKIAAGATSKPLDINDYLIDPAHKPLITTVVSQQTAAPAGKLTVKATGSKIVLTSTVGFVGPAAVTLQVTDGKTVSSPGATTGYVTIPVQVGDPTAVLRCPTTPLPALYQGGQPESFDIPTVCNVWMPDGVSLDDLTFTARPAKSVAGVAISTAGRGSRQVTLTPSSAAKAGGQGSVELGIQGSTQHQSLAFAVAAAPAMTLSPITISGVKNNETKSVDVASYAKSPFLSPNFKVLACTRSGGTDASCTVSGSTVTVRPADTARGTASFTLKVTDQPTDPSRTVTGQITVDILGHPTAPGSVTADANRTNGGEVRVSWTTPDNDGGAPIDYYQVSYTGGTSGTQQCPSSPCVISGLTNGAAYTFTVRTHNAAGEFSLPPDPRSNTVKPDAKPDAVTGVTIGSPVGDGTLTVSWAPAHNTGSAITHYIVEITDVGTHASGTSQVTLGNVTSFVKSGLNNNDPYQFRVAAQNDDGIGPFSAPVQGQSAGKPASLAAPSVPAEQATAPSPDVTVSVSWQPEPDPNGPPLKSYTVYRGVGSQSGAKPLPQCTGLSATGALTCTDQIPNDGKANYYAVTATNGAGIESDPVNFTEFDAVGVPDAVAAVTAAASANPGGGPQTDTGPGFDGAIKVSFVVPQPNGSAIQTMQYSLNGGGWTAFAGTAWPPGSSQSETISGLVNGNSYTVAVRAGNEKNFGPPSPASNTVYPYGAPPVPTGTASHDGNVVTYSWSGSTNGRPVHYWVSIDGKAAVDKGTSPGSEQDDRGYAYDYSIAVYAVDAAGNQSASSATVTGKTPDVPPPGSVSCSDSSTTITCGWSAPSGSGLSYLYQWDGGGWNATTGTSAANNFSGDTTPTTHTLTVKSHAVSKKDGGGLDSSTVSGNAQTQPPAVTVAQGKPCQGSTCNSKHPDYCTSTDCHFINVTTSGFSGTVTCLFNSSTGSGGFISQNYGPNDRHDSQNFFGHPNGWVQVTCDGVASPQTAWP